MFFQSYTIWKVNILNSKISWNTYIYRKFIFLIFNIQIWSFELKAVIKTEEYFHDLFDLYLLKYSIIL